MKGALISSALIVGFIVGALLHGPGAAVIVGVGIILIGVVVALASLFALGEKNPPRNRCTHGDEQMVVSERLDGTREVRVYCKRCFTDTTPRHAID